MTQGTDDNLERDFLLRIATDVSRGIAPAYPYCAGSASPAAELLSDRHDGSAIECLQGVREHNSLFYLDVLGIEFFQLTRLGQ